MDVAKLNREARKPPLFNKGFWSLLKKSDKNELLAFN
jgi:hypothetical protein